MELAEPVVEHLLADHYLHFSTMSCPSKRKIPSILIRVLIPAGYLGGNIERAIVKEIGGIYLFILYMIRITEVNFPWRL